MKIFSLLPAGFGVLVALTISIAPARAQPGLVPDAPATPAPASQGHTERYGHWVAAVDVAGFAATMATDDLTFVAGTYLLAAPAVHLFHGNPRAALGSLGVRAGSLMVGIMVGAALSDCGWQDANYCMPDRRPAGMLIGAGAGVLIDWLILAKKTTREAPTPPALLRAGSVRASPALRIDGTGNMVLGLRGSF